VSARLPQWATALAVLAVATIAAIVSYAHVESVALANGYSIGTARLSPFSVDGLIVASSLVLANGARPWLARTGLVLGIVATMAANAVYGDGHGPVGIVVNMWPSVASVLASEILLSMLRARPVADEAPETTNQVELEPVTIAPVTPVVGTSRAGAVRPVPTRTRPNRKPSPDKLFAADIAAGRVPSLRAVKEGCHVGTDKAREIREQLVALVGNEAVAA
jgi:hypothetical protein